MRTYYCLNCGYSFSEADKSWDIAIQSGRCPKCVGRLGEGKVDERTGATLDPAVSVQQNEIPFPRQPYPWGSVLMWVGFAFLLGLITPQTRWKLIDSTLESVLRVFTGAAYATITAIVVGVYKYFNRKPNQFFSRFFSGYIWLRVTPEEAKKHPLYGVRGWLLLFAVAILFGFLSAVSTVNTEALKSGFSLSKLLAVGIPETIFLKLVLWIRGLIVLPIYWLLFSKHPSFRPVSICLLLGLWPGIALAGFLNPFPSLGESLVFSFIPWAVSCAIWVTYLQRSERVRVTFEHSVKAGRDNAASTSLPPSFNKPAITGKSAQEGQFNDASTGTREQVPPSRMSKDMSSLQPIVKPTTSIPISDKPSQNTAEAHEDRLYTQIAQELETNTIDKALWTKAYAQAGGDEKQTRALYIKARFARLRDIKDI